jgi:hypothetical protein
MLQLTAQPAQTPGTQKGKVNTIYKALKNGID